MKMNLLVLTASLLLAIGYVAAGNDCCYKQTLGGTDYTFVESDSSLAASYECNAPGSCIYKDPAGDRFCFKMGGTDVPTCRCTVWRLTPNNTDVLLVRPDDTAVEIWNPDNCYSTQLPALSQPLGEGFQGGFLMNKVYLCVADSCYSLDMSNPEDRWKKTDFPHNTRFHTLSTFTMATSYGIYSMFLATGGANSDGKLVDKTSTFLGKWEENKNAKLKFPMQKHCACTGPDHMWVIGGVTEGHAAGIKTVSVSKAKTNTWDDVADFPKNVFDAACAYDGSQNKIYVAAGKDFYALRVADNVWDTLPEVPDAIKGGGYSMALFKGRITLFGGMTENGGQKSDAVYAFDMGKWNAIGTLRSAFAKGSAIKLAP